VNKTSILFDEANMKKGVLINVDNQSGSDQTLGIELPQKGLIYKQVIRKPEQIKVPRDSWDRFIVPPNCGIFVILIPENYPEQLKTLDGTHVVVKLYQRNEVRKIIRIPIKVASDLLKTSHVYEKEKMVRPFLGRRVRSGSVGASGRVQEADGRKALDGQSATTRSGPDCHDSVCVDKTSILFDEANMKKGALINVDNKSDSARTLGIRFPQKGLLYKQMIRKPERLKVPRESWDRFILQGNSGIFIVLLPDVNPKQLKTLDGAHIVVKVYQGNEAREILRIPIKVAPDLHKTGHVYAKQKNAAGRMTRVQSGWGFVTDLMNAALGGKPDLVRKLLDEGADVNASERHGLTALMLAVRGVPWTQGHTDVVKLLLENGAVVDAKDNFGWTALSWAARGGRSDVVELLLDKGADVNTKDKSGWTPLSWAARSGLSDTVKLLLDGGADVNPKDLRGETAMDWAARSCHMDVLRLLKARGADLSLTAAACLGDLKRVQRLIREGVDVNTKDHGGSTPLMAAAMEGSSEVVRELLDNRADPNTRDKKSGGTPLMMAADRGHANVVRVLLEQGADVNVRDKNGITPLMSAVWRAAGDRTDLVKLLLDKGADVRARDNHGVTTLMRAAASGRIGLVKLLLDRGADVKAKDNHGATAFMRAARGLSKVHGELAKLLLERGADVNTKDNYGITALMKAALTGRTEMVKLLLDEGANVHATTKSGVTVLMQAACRPRRGRADMVKLLLDGGADVNAKNARGGTAIRCAAWRGHTNVVKLLKAHGAKE